jgi:glycerol-3-phosphate acyltransferase PlsY
LGVWILIILITRYVSVSSIIACLLASSLIWIPIFRNNYLIDTTDHSVTLLFIFIILQFGSLLVLVRHIPNIKKLISGTENKAFTKK